MVVKGHGLYALAVASEATRFTGRTRNTPQGTSATACSINYDVDAQVRTSRFRREEVDGAAVSFDHKSAAVLRVSCSMHGRIRTHFLVGNTRTKVAEDNLPAKYRRICGDRALQEPAEN